MKFLLVSVFLSRFWLSILTTLSLNSSRTAYRFFLRDPVVFRFGLNSKFDVEFQQGLSAKVSFVSRHMCTLTKRLPQLNK